MILFGDSNSLEAKAIVAGNIKALVEISRKLNFFYLWKIDIGVSCE